MHHKNQSSISQPLTIYRLCKLTVPPQKESGSAVRWPFLRTKKKFTCLVSTKADKNLSDILLSLSCQNFTCKDESIRLPDTGKLASNEHDICCCPITGIKLGMCMKTQSNIEEIPLHEVAWELENWFETITCVPIGKHHCIRTCTPHAMQVFYQHWNYLNQSQIEHQE